MSFSILEHIWWDFCFHFERWLLYSIEFQILSIERVVECIACLQFNVILYAFQFFIIFFLIVRCLSPNWTYLIFVFWISFCHLLPFIEHFSTMRFFLCFLTFRHNKWEAAKKSGEFLSCFCFCFCFLEKFYIFHFQLMIARPWFVICIDVCHQRITGTINALANYTTILFLAFGMLIGDVSFQWCLRT